MGSHPEDRAQGAGHGLSARHDILIRGGLLFDGTGAAGKPGDVAIRDGRIAAVGADIDDAAAKVIDAHGLAVAPGFIDPFRLHAADQSQGREQGAPRRDHRDRRPCGFSVAPALPGKVELLRDYLSASAPWLPFKATTFSDYLASFPATAVNAGMLVGHNTLR